MHDARSLSRRIASLLAEERNSLADFLVALADFDRQRGWAELGYATLHQYLERELELTGGPAFYRRVAVGLIQKFPSIIEPIRDGRICLTAVHALSQVLTAETEAEVLPRFYGLSREKASPAHARGRWTALRALERVREVAAFRAAPVPSSCVPGRPRSA